MKVFNQNNYSNLEIDLSEEDIISIWMKEKEENNVIIIERKNIEALCKVLIENQNNIVRL